MTREEQINEAVETYMNGLFEDGIEIPIEDYENIEEGFVAGAKWADKHPKFENAWHDAYEEPISVYDCKMQNREYPDLNQLWHLPNERPKGGMAVVAITDDYDVVTGDFDESCWGVFQYTDWRIADWDSIVKWTYLMDFINLMK